MTSAALMTVSGIRGVYGESVTEEFFAAIAYTQTKLSNATRVVVGRDTRPSGASLAEAIFKAIRAAGAEPIDLGIAPTPTTGIATHHLGAQAGIILTASHNPSPYNGYKMVHGSGRLYNAAECEAVYQAYREGRFVLPPDALQKAVTVTRFDAAALHVQKILASLDVETIRQAGISVAIDATNGAASAVFPRLLEALGVRWSGVYTALDGNFVHNPEPRPEHLTELAALLRETPGAWAGFAFDPDADRLAPLCENGDAVTEEMTLTLALDNILSRTPGSVATNLSTSMLVDDVARRHGVEVFRTRIGEANVVQGMVEHGCIGGGEGNGGVIYPPISTVRDGLGALGLIIELMAQRKLPLSKLAAQWPQYAIVKDKVQLGSLDPAMVLQELARMHASESIDTQDGLKIIGTSSWVHIRPSNTEPILRCIAEAPSLEEAQQLARQILDEVQELS